MAKDDAKGRTNSAQSQRLDAVIARSVKQDQIITILQDELRALRWRVTQLETQIDWAYNPSKRKACRHV